MMNFGGWTWGGCIYVLDTWLCIDDYEILYCIKLLGFVPLLKMGCE